MVNPGASFWGLKEGTTASIPAGHTNFLACGQNYRGRAPRIQTECGDRRGHHLWNRDRRNAPVRSVLRRVEETGIQASWR